MIEEPPLLRINSAQKRPTADQIAAFQGVPTGFVNDALFGAGAMGKEICPIGEGRDITCVAAGPALSINCKPGDILATLAALGSIRKGDILVAAFAGYQGCAAAGDRVLGMARNAGAAGFITDGPMRDYAGLVDVALPCWCTGLTPASPVAKGPGEVGFPVQIAGQQVETGDMVVADRDGVVVVPFAKIDAVIKQLGTVAELEAAMDAEVAKGLSLPPSIAELLESDQVSYSDG